MKVISEVMYGTHQRPCACEIPYRTDDQIMTVYCLRRAVTQFMGQDSSGQQIVNRSCLTERAHRDVRYVRGDQTILGGQDQDNTDIHFWPEISTHQVTKYSETP